MLVVVVFLCQVLVPVIPTAVCDRIYTTSLRRQYTTDPTSFCAGGQQGKDTCSVSKIGLPICRYDFTVVWGSTSRFYRKTEEPRCKSIVVEGFHIRMQSHQTAKYLKSHSEAFFSRACISAERLFYVVAGKS